LPQGIAHGADFLRPFHNLRKLGGVKITFYGEFAEDFPNSTGSILGLISGHLDRDHLKPIQKPQLAGRNPRADGKTARQRRIEKIYRCETWVETGRGNVNCLAAAARDNWTTCSAEPCGCTGCAPLRMEFYHRPTSPV